MLAEKPSFKKWISLSAVLGFAVFLFYLYFFTDFTQVGIVIGGTNVAIYLLAFLSVMGSAVFDAYTWKAILDNLKVETTFTRIFNLSWVGHFVDTLIPGGWTGDVFKTYLLSKDRNVQGSKAAASIIIKDVLELFVILSSLIAGIVLLALNYTVSNTVMAAIGITLVFLSLPLILVIYFSTNVDATEKLLRLIERAPKRIKRKQSNSAAFQDKIHRQITEFHDGIMSIKTNPKSMVKPIVYQCLAWVFDVMTLFLVFVALGSFVGFDKVLITNTIVSNIQGQGVALAGFSQIVSSTLYTVLGIAPVLAIASSLLAGFASFWFRLVISFGYFQITVFERCVPFFCKKCGGWRNRRTKTCTEDVPKNTLLPTKK
jgi:glycosyltransferase 2 family protein